jgi:hypothetical protein
LHLKVSDKLHFAICVAFCDAPRQTKRQELNALSANFHVSLSSSRIRAAFLAVLDNFHGKIAGQPAPPQTLACSLLSVDVALALGSTCFFALPSLWKLQGKPTQPIKLSDGEVARAGPGPLFYPFRFALSGGITHNRATGSEPWE